MKITAYLLISLGIVFGVLFGLAVLGGAQLPRLACSIVVMLIAGGWNLKKVASGRGQVPPPAGPTAPTTPTFQEGTVSLPITPAIAGLIARRRAKSRRVISYIVAGGLLLFTGGGTILALTVRPDDGSSMTATLAIMIAVLDVVWTALVGGIWYFVGGRPSRKDIQSSAYLRSTGPVSVTDMASAAISKMAKVVRVGDRSFLLEDLANYKTLSSLQYGTIDYTQHTHIILAIWDRSGRNLFQLPGYDNSPRCTPATR